MKRNTLFFCLGLTMALYSCLWSQTDPEGQLDYIYIECPIGLPKTGSVWLGVPAKFSIDNTDTNRIVEFDVPGNFTGENVVAICDSCACLQHCMFGSSLPSSFFGVNGRLPNYQYSGLALNMITFDTTAVTGVGTLGQFPILINDTGTICLDTISNGIHYPHFKTKSGIIYTLGWGGTTGQGYPDSIGVCCKIDYCEIPGDTDSSRTLTLVDVIRTVNYIFNRPGCDPFPDCWLSGLLCRGDWNGDKQLSLTDAIRGANYILGRPYGPWNPIPSAECCWIVP